MSVPAEKMSFDQRLMAKIKDSIGDLMTEADLKKIVERGVEEALFKPRIESTDSYGRQTTKPPLVQEIVEAHLKTHIRDAVDKWLVENHEKVLPAMEKITQAGIGNALLEAINVKFSRQLQSFGQSLVDQLGQRR